MGTDGQRQRHIWCSPTWACSSNREGHKDTRIPSLSHTTRSAFPRILPPNMATSSSRISYSTIFGTVAASGLAYAVYFDYMRRNNVEFRRNLLKEQKKVAKQAHVEASKGKEATADALKNAVRQMKSEPVPTNVEEREAYFLEQVAIGEALAAKGPAFYVPAAISFFKGLQVYPQPQELLMIYSKTQPAEVVQLLMDALRSASARARDPLPTLPLQPPGQPVHLADRPSSKRSIPTTAKGPASGLSPPPTASQTA